MTDVVYQGDPVLNHAGRFELVATLLGIVMTAILLLGLLERRDRTILRMGYDCAAMIVIFFGGVAILYGLSDG
jgi:cation:H+ antiporter